MLLIGDIGGTHTRLSFFEDDKLIDLEILSSQDFPTFLQALSTYLKSRGKKEISKACFGVAGPVVDGVCKVTNLPWIIDRKEILSFLKCQDVFVINDLEALAWAIPILPKTSFVPLNLSSKTNQGNRALVAPGTGLGESVIYWDGAKYHPFATEGGHVDFAPINDLQRELGAYLSTHFDHPSYERALSGPGLNNIFSFLAEKDPQKLSPQLKEKRREKNFSHLITQLAIEKKSPLCEEALDLFVTLLGQEASNLALKFMATGGIYLGGGIVPHILPKLQSPIFKEAFLNKGRFRPLLQTLPLFAIIDQLAPLKGSASLIRNALHAGY